MRNFFSILIICFAMLYPSKTLWANELDTLLQNMASHSTKTQSLQANFSQEKQLSFLKQSLNSKGHFFFTKSYQGKPAILWEYLSPAPSGILFQNDEGWIWVQQRSQLKKAEGYEGNVLNTMIKQILLWFVFEPSTLKNHYDISLEPAPASNSDSNVAQNIKEKNAACLKLTPKDQTFFTYMQLCVDKSNYTIKSIQFNEAKSDSTKLKFHNIQINTVYPKNFPDGTPFP